MKDKKKYVGVSYDKSNGRYKSSIKLNKKLYHISYKTDEYECYKDYMKIVKYLRRFGEDKTIEHINNNRIYKTRTTTMKRPRKKSENTSSIYKGVSFDNRSNRWISRIVIEGKNYYLGSGKSEIGMSSLFNFVDIYMLNNYGRDITIEKIRNKQYLTEYHNYKIDLKRRMEMFGLG